MRVAFAVARAARGRLRLRAAVEVERADARLAGAWRFDWSADTSLYASACGPKDSTCRYRNVRLPGSRHDCVSIALDSPGVRSGFP